MASTAIFDGSLSIEYDLITLQWLAQTADWIPQAETAYGAAHGCQPMNGKLPYEWPLALDLLKQQYDANKEKRLLYAQTPWFDKTGPNMEVTLIGTKGFMTFDPENLEAVYSTNFEGLNRALK